MGRRSKEFSLSQASARWWVMLLALVGGSIWLYARPGPQPGGAAVVIEGPTMGTRYRVVVPGGEVFDRVRVRSDIEATLARLVSLMSTYEPTSELSRFNASDSVEPFPIAPETRTVLEIALDVWRGSGGAFDATVGPLVNLWGFGPNGPPDVPPTDAELEAVMNVVGSSGLVLTEGGVSKARGKMQVDLSAVAKGYAVDRVAETLEGLDVAAYLVEIGGEVRVRGEKRPGEPFRVAVERPDPDARATYGVFALDRGALATSGNYRNFYERDGVRYVHTLDPTSGRPVENRLMSASVLHASCAWADAWATALMVSGDAAWTLARRNDLEVLLLYAGRDGEIEERITPGMAALRRPMVQERN